MLFEWRPTTGLHFNRQDYNQNVDGFIRNTRSQVMIHKIIMKTTWNVIRASRLDKLDLKGPAGGYRRWSVMQ